MNDFSQCPKCHYQRQAIDASVNADICPACGIVYRKWLARQQPQDSAEKPQDSEQPTFSIEPHLTFKQKMAAQFLFVPEAVDAGAFWARAITLFLFAVWGGYFILAGVDWELLGSSFMHAVNLPFHEFGHVLFSFFGRFMMILGGSLFQVLMPLGLLIVFSWQQRDNFAAAIMLWWSGQSFIDVSPYIADAPYRSLPLIGGMGEESHDWGNLLTMMNAVDSAATIANICFAFGSLLIITAIAWGSYILYLQKKNIRSL